MAVTHDQWFPVFQLQCSTTFIIETLLQTEEKRYRKTLFIDLDGAVKTVEATENLARTTILREDVANTILAALAEKQTFR